MKRFFKIFLPIVLVLLVLGSIVWYLLVYDRGFTRDILLQQARYYEKKGNHTVAAWLYDAAYAQSSQDDSVAIELAEQFKSIGNYTKAEYTLSRAIADGGSSDLYIALCKTYVEQDKLLDAVSMLENITDPEIKAELDALRPKAPTTSPEPGFYTQYITVEIDGGSNTLCVNTEGNYPSLNDSSYSGSFELPEGETTIYALCVSENGLVSELAIFGYTVGGIVEKVIFTDSQFESAVRTTLGIDEDDDIYTNELWTITEFEIPAAAESYEDLQFLPYLKTLTIQNGTADLSPIAALTSLEELNLSGCNPNANDIQMIGTLPSLKKLTLSGCNLSSISGLENAVLLEYLDLSNNTLRNMEAITPLTALKELYLQHNALSDVSSFSSLTNLQTLDISYNAVTSVSALSSCTALQWLSAAHNSLESADGINRLSALTYLDLSNNLLTEINLLSSCTHLAALNISNNSITDITAFSSLLELTNFDFSNNQITALPEWSSDCAMITINGSNNLVESIDVLGGFQYLNNVYMDYNLLTSVDALSDCPRLMTVNVYGNQIADVSALTSQDVIVNYNPIAADTDESDSE